MSSSVRNVCFIPGSEMNLYSLVLFVAAITCTLGTGYDPRVLKHYPSPMPNLNVNMFQGQWYYYAGRASCAWQGLDDVSDFGLVYTAKHPGCIMTTCDIRYRGDCSVLQGKQTFDPHSPATQSYTDTIGGIVSGTKVVVATDYKTFHVNWGCAQPAVDGFCKAPWVSVHTRKPRPGPATLRIVNQILQHTWGIQLGDLIKMRNSNPCQQPKLPPRMPMLMAAQPKSQKWK